MRPNRYERASSRGSRLFPLWTGIIFLMLAVVAWPNFIGLADEGSTPQAFLPLFFKSEKNLGLNTGPGGGLLINFQTESSETPSGFLPDEGFPYGDRGNGYHYGWNADNRANARDRNSSNSPGQEYDTFNHMQKDGNWVWELGVAAGTYQVRVVAGEPAHTDGTYRIEVEGVLVVNGQSGSGQNWVDGTGQVQVGDGKLTLKSGQGAVNNKVAFVVVTALGQAPQPKTSPTPSPRPYVLSTAFEWTQEAHDAQHSGYTEVEPLEPWTLLWTWNGPDAQGGAGNHYYNAPYEARTVTGGENVFVPAGSALFALRKANGAQAWSIKATSFNATPAYDPASGYLFAGGANGLLYKINGADGGIAGTYQAGSPINKAVLLAGSYAYVVTDSGQLHKVNTADMTAAWVYSAGSSVATPPAYSASHGLLVYATDDLYVHAVSDTNGAVQWRVKPTVNQPGEFVTFDGGWPVIAERHGIVFVRLNLGEVALWTGPGPNRAYPTTNAATRAFLETNPHLKNLFALDLVTGQERFTPAVGYGGVEQAFPDGRTENEMGTIPVVKTFADGTEVVYIPFRNGVDSPDGNWDSHVGEMVLDDSAISGMVAGDLRFVEFRRSQTNITDEQTPWTLAGDTLFNAHWGASESTRIIDRSPSLGLTHDNPIRSQLHPAVIRRIEACDYFDPVSHWSKCGMALFGDPGRYWDSPGWWVYWNRFDPPTTTLGGYGYGLLPRYTYVSGNLIIIEGNGGELFVLYHSGVQ